MTRPSDPTFKRSIAVFVAALLMLPVIAGPAPAAQRVRISGGGWGHGIGMSQYGAYGMAREGKSGTGILKHYYRGVGVQARSMPTVRVGLLQYDSAIGMSSNGGPVRFAVAGDGTVARGGAAATWRVEPSSTGRMRIYKNDRLVTLNGRRTFGGPDKPLLVLYERLGSSVTVFDKGIAYRLGRLEVGTFRSSSCAAGYCLRLVMRSSMEKYLYGLGEVPASWPQAVLRAQAMAGRTYAYRKINTYGQHRSPCDCAVVDSVYDQAYIGDAKRTGSGEYWDDWKRAVDKTAGKVILYNGSPIEALYSSSSGGYTENNENVWGGTPIPYLRGVPDPADDVSVNPNHEWSLDMSREAFSSRLNSAYGIGRLKRISLVRPFGVSGRVTVVKSSGGGIRIVGTQRTVRVSGWSFRSALGLKDTLFRIKLYFPIWREMVEKHSRLRGAPGDATSPAYYVPRGADGRGQGRAQNFEKGRMTWRRKTDKTVWQYGRILRTYNRLGREGSVLGMPTSDVRGPGWYLAGNYVNGSIVWSRGNGAFPIVGKWARKFRAHGGVRGKLGPPLSKKETAASLPGRGRRQRFKRGRLYAPPGGGAIRALWGPIAERYVSIEEASSACGYPTSDVHSVADGVEADFENGRILYSKAAGVRVRCPDDELPLPGTDG